MLNPYPLNTVPPNHEEFCPFDQLVDNYIEARENRDSTNKAILSNQIILTVKRIVSRATCADSTLREIIEILMALEDRSIDALLVENPVLSNALISKDLLKIGARSAQARCNIALNPAWLRAISVLQVVKWADDFYDEALKRLIAQSPTIISMLTPAEIHDFYLKSPHLKKAIARSLFTASNLISEDRKPYWMEACRPLFAMLLNNSHSLAKPKFVHSLNYNSVLTAQAKTLTGCASILDALRELSLRYPFKGNQALSSVHLKVFHLITQNLEMPNHNKFYRALLSLLLLQKDPFIDQFILIQPQLNVCLTSPNLTLMAKRDRETHAQILNDEQLSKMLSINDHLHWIIESSDKALAIRILNNPSWVRALEYAKIVQLIEKFPECTSPLLNQINYIFHFSNTHYRHEWTSGLLDIMVVHSQVFRKAIYKDIDALVFIIKNNLLKNHDWLLDSPALGQVSKTQAQLIFKKHPQCVHNAAFLQAFARLENAKFLIATSPYFTSENLPVFAKECLEISPPLTELGLYCAKLFSCQTRSEKYDKLLQSAALFIFLYGKLNDFDNALHWIKVAQGFDEPQFLEECKLFLATRCSEPLTKEQQILLQSIQHPRDKSDKPKDLSDLIDSLDALNLEKHSKSSEAKTARLEDNLIPNITTQFKTILRKSNSFSTPNRKVSEKHLEQEGVFFRRS